MPPDSACTYGLINSLALACRAGPEPAAKSFSTAMPRPPRIRKPLESKYPRPFNLFGPFNRLPCMIDTPVAKTCTPCRGGIPPLTPQEAEHFQLHVPQWEVCDESRHIERTFRVRNFREAFALVQQVVELAEAEGHHPDISFGWGYVTVSRAQAASRARYRTRWAPTYRLRRAYRWPPASTTTRRPSPI